MLDDKTSPVEGFTEVDFNSATFLSEAKHVYERLHSGGCPYAHSPKGDHYAVGSHKAIVALLKKHATWKARFGPGLSYLETPGVLTSIDPPDHAFEARMVARSFSQDVYQAQIPAIEDFVREQIDQVEQQGHADLHQLLSIPLPLFAIFRLIGLDRYDENNQDRFPWVHQGVLGQVSLMYLTQLQAMLYIASQKIPQDRVDAVVKLQELLSAHLKMCRENLESGSWTPDTNMVTRFLSSDGPDGKPLPEDKILGFLSFLMVAGTATTTTMLTNVTYRLLTEPGVCERLRDDQGLIPMAIEECLRLDAPVRGLFRTNSAPTLLGATKLDSDTKVLLMWAAANVDPDVFDNPMAFDLDRDPASVKRHLSFGYGTHFCRGAPLARLEGDIFLRHILARLPDLRLNGAPVLEDRAPVLQAYRSMPVAWKKN